MSKPEDNGGSPEAVAFTRLENAVGGLIDALAAARRRAADAEARNAELASLVERFTGNETDAREVMGRLGTLEAENEDLRTRLERGREGVDRMIARIRFLENQG